MSSDRHGYKTYRNMDPRLMAIELDPTLVTLCNLEPAQVLSVIPRTDWTHEDLQVKYFFGFPPVLQFFYLLAYAETDESDLSPNSPPQYFTQCNLNIYFSLLHMSSHLSSSSSPLPLFLTLPLHSYCFFFLHLLLILLCVFSTFSLTR